MWPFMGPLVVDENDPNTAYADEPFTNPAPWATHITATNLNNLVTAGFDHIRLPVVPGVWMDALGDQTRLDYLFSVFDEAIDDCIAAGLGVLIDLHDTYYVKNTPDQLLADGVLGTLFQKRVSVTELFAQHYASYDPKMLCIEVFNEPLHADNINGNWVDYLDALYNAVRTNMPNHTIVLTAENYSWFDQLIAFNPTNYDDNTLWVLHPYAPTIFAVQGYPENTINKYVYGISYPPNPDEKTTAIANMETNVDADTGLTTQEKTDLKASLTATLGFFYDTPEDMYWLNGMFDNVVNWCKTYNMPTNRIICSEYGVTRDNVDYFGAPQPSRINYLNTIGPLMWIKNFRTNIFALDAIDYGITDGIGSNIGTIPSELRVSGR